MKFTNILTIHLTRFRSLKDFERLVQSNGYTFDSMNPQKLFDLKKEGFLKIFVDKNTFEVIASTHKSDRNLIKLNLNFENFLKNDKSIDFVNNINLSLDDILDKISDAGIDSLNKFEKSFLENQSKR